MNENHENRFCLHGSILGWNCDACLPRCVGCGRLTDREILNDHGLCWRDDRGRCWLCRMIDNNFEKSDALRLKFKALFDGMRSFWQQNKRQPVLRQDRLEPPRS
jgi:hypothetical protein